MRTSKAFPRIKRFLLMTLCLATAGGSLPVLHTVADSDTAVAAASGQDCDLEFSTAASVESFTVENGNVDWSNGRLIYTIGGADSSLTSPSISAAQGTAYSMLLPLRNTILIHMSNDTSASQMRLSYVTTNDRTYSADKSLVLDILPHSEDTTYYFNLSGCPKLTGYLYGFRLEPIGADTGRIEIEAVTFEREATITEAVGKLVSCTTDGQTVTIKGELEPAYAGRKVTLYETTAGNGWLTLKSNEKLTSVTADGNTFTLTVPLEDGNMTRLSSLFLLGVAGDDGTDVRLCDRFWIQNAETYSGGNPYSFTLPDYTVSVLDFGAKGDGFTNDTAAIQSAIDHVTAQGGGVVVLPGDDSFYGRRYVATNICLRDNIELRIETGAVVWQSPRVEDYDYDVAIGHDMDIPGVNWAHAGSCHNYPLIYGGEVKNVRVTGGGTIRMQDGGSEFADSVASGSVWTGCGNKIHLIPLGFWRCENVELNDVHLRRTNNYHINFRTCLNIYVHGVSMWDVTCASGDGISATVGTKNITIDQCFLNSNDDAVTICSTYNDPRGLAWWHANPDGDNCVENVVVRHSHLIGGHGITFITWGTDNPNLELQEIRDVEVFDCVLGGNSAAVGAWPDNPYFGKDPYDGSETTDYSPVKGVRIYDNKYLSQTTLESIQGTDIITDCGISSATRFQYGNFERKLRKKYTGYLSGLSNWSFLPVEGQDGHAVAETETSGESDNHYGALYGNGTLCQGLWMRKGKHTLKMDVRLLSGSASLIAQDVLTGELLAELPLTASQEFQSVEMDFDIVSGTTVYLGVTHTGTADEVVHIDNASVTNPAFAPAEYFTEHFDEPERVHLTNKGFTLTGDVAEAGAGLIGIQMLQTPNTYADFDLHYRVRFDGANSDTDANIGVSLRRADADSQYDIHYEPLQHLLLVREYAGAQETTLFQANDIDLPMGEWVDMAFRVQNDTCLWYMNGEKVAEFPMTSVSSGMIALVSYNSSCAYDDVTLAPVGTTVITGDEDFSTETETEAASETETVSETEAVVETETAKATETTSEAETEAKPDITTETASEPTHTTTIDTDTDTNANNDAGCHSSLGTGSATLPTMLAALTLGGGALTVNVKRRKKRSRG